MANAATKSRIKLETQGRIINQPGLFLAAQSFMRRGWIEVPVMMAIALHRHTRGLLQGFFFATKLVRPCMCVIRRVQPDLATLVAKLTKQCSEFRLANVVEAIRGAGGILCQ